MTQQTLMPSTEMASNNQADKSDLLIPSRVIDENELIGLSHIKRFYERWSADRNFREQMAIDPEQAIARYKLNVDPDEVRPLWDIEFLQQCEKPISVSPSVERFQKLFIEGLKWAKSKHNLPLKDSRFKAWRERQLARTASQFHPTYHEAIAHIPVCFELSKGCSVGCWFCAVSAPRLGDIFTYTQENAKLWCEVLELIRTILGPAAGEGCCYWATDPLDNPDYEKFCTNFHQILGTFPQTTTAQPLKDPDRIRALLKLSKEKGCQLNRFSIVSLKIFNQLHEEFSAEELASVKLVLQNPESNSIKANAGRARERNKKKANQDRESFEESSQPTIACVTGFLFSMVDRSVKLISPCVADDRWPDGYRIYDEGVFSSSNDLAILLERMIANNMPFTVRHNEPISFRRDLKYESLPDGFQLSTRYLTRKFRNQPYIKELGEVIYQGDKTAGEIALLFDTFGLPRANTLYSLDFLFQKGVLNDEP